VVNTFDYLDANTFSVLSLSADDRYALSIDWRRPVHFSKEQFHQKVTAKGLDFEGFSLLTQPTAGPPGVAWEFTAQLLVERPNCRLRLQTVKASLPALSRGATNCPRSSNA
jgi:hypothetical protein